MDGKITHHSLLAMLIGEMMMIEARGLDMMLAIASRQVITPEMIQQYRAQPVEKGRKLGLREGGVGIIPIMGPIFRHATMFADISGATSTDQIAKDIGVALQSEEIKSIVMEIDSPGGQAAGMFELAGLIREANAQKPVTAYVRFDGFSAAYELAAAAGKVVANRTASVGSIGILSAWTSTKKAKEALGLEDIVKRSSQSPKKALDPETPEGNDELQKQLDFLGGKFIEDVAKYRGKSRKTVLEDFGQGAVVNADDALKVGMIDDFGTMEGVIRAVGGGRRYRPTSTSVAASSPVGTISGESAVAKTWREFFSSLGVKPDDPIPESQDSIMRNPHDAPSSSSDDPAELRRQLAEERQRREAAEARASESAQATEAERWAGEKARIEARVAGWVGHHIHPHQKQTVLAQCLRLAEADRKLGQVGPGSLLDAYCLEKEAHDMGLLSDEVAQNKVPLGGRVETPASSPPAPDASAPQSAEHEKQRQFVREALGKNGKPAATT
jgi:ClpP class serine protease